MENSIALFTGVLLSLVFSFLPGFKTWYNKYEPKKKQILMIAFLAVASVLVGGLNCAGLAIEGVPVFSCDASGVADIVELFILAVVANVGTHQSTNYLK